MSLILNCYDYTNKSPLTQLADWVLFPLRTALGYKTIQYSGGGFREEDSKCQNLFLRCVCVCIAPLSILVFPFATLIKLSDSTLLNIHQLYQHRVVLIDPKMLKYKAESLNDSRAKDLKFDSNKLEKLSWYATHLSVLLHNYLKNLQQDGQESLENKYFQINYITSTQAQLNFLFLLGKEKDRKCKIGNKEYPISCADFHQLLKQIICDFPHVQNVKQNKKGFIITFKKDIKNMSIEDRHPPIA